jgi:hypothetical protein
VTIVRRLVLAGAAGVLLLLVGCPQPGPLDTYVGLNLIPEAQFGFAVPLRWTPDDPTYVAPQGTYMRFETTAEAPPAAAPTAAVWRLEIRNQLPNGDFEASPPGFPPAGWMLLNNSGSAVLDVVDTGAYAITNRTMTFDLRNRVDRLDLDLRNAVTGLLDTLPANNTYIVRFDYRINFNQAVVFEFNNGIAPQSSDTWNGYGNLSTVRSFPPVDTFPIVTVGTNPAYYYSVGSLDTTKGRPQHGAIDNVRVIRTSQTYFARMTVPSTDPGLADELIAGPYRFSLWVEKDPVAAPNRFPASNVEVLLQRTFKDGGGAVIASNTAIMSVALSGTGWQMVSVDLGGAERLDAATVEMEIAVSPTDETHGANGMDCGSILISAPTLEMYPGGF